MIKTYATPLNIQIINKGTTKNSFVPYHTNENFMVDAGGKIAFSCDKSEKVLYYLQQSNKDLEVSFIEPMESDIEVGKYDKTTDDLTPGAPYICKTLSQNVVGGIVKVDYEVLGALNYSTDDLGLRQPDGNRFIIKLRNTNVASTTSIANSGHSIWISDGDTQTKVFGKDAFNSDGSLVVILNIKKPTSKVTISIKWDKNADHDGQVDYSFSFTTVTFGKDGETYPDLQNVDISTNQEITLTNNGDNTTLFVPYHENFIVSVPSGDNITLETKDSEEVMYYLLQENKDLKVTL